MLYRRNVRSHLKYKLAFLHLKKKQNLNSYSFNNGRSYLNPLNKNKFFSNIERKKKMRERVSKTRSLIIREGKNPNFSHRVINQWNRTPTDCYKHFQLQLMLDKHI